MHFARSTKIFLLAVTLGAVANAQSTSSAAQCSSSLTASYPAPSLASGYKAQLIAQNLTRPRGIRIDDRDNLLVVQAGVGVSAHSIVDLGNDCLSLSSSKLVVNQSDLNHGIEVLGNTLYASSSASLWEWQYDPQNQETRSEAKELVGGMDGSDHTSRTLLLSRLAPGIMVINRGSFSNFDSQALDITTGVSQIKAFNISNVTDTPYQFNSSGLMLGWGLRNNVGIAEEPVTGGIYSVENSADQVTRAHIDIHENNPAEKLNFLGYLNGTSSPNQGRNFGYPRCFSAWDPTAVPDYNGTVGGQEFAVDFEGIVGVDLNDSTCEDRQTPRLSFAAHLAPLDIVFNPSGTAAWITFHGSWNRDTPIGYKLSLVEFNGKGEPVDASSSTTAARDIMSNANVSACASDGNPCFRPVGLAWDSKGRLFMSSDATGEIYVITRTDGNATSAAGSTVNGTVPSATGSGAASQTATSNANGSRAGISLLVIGLFCLFTL